MVPRIPEVWDHQDLPAFCRKSRDQLEGQWVTESFQARTSLQKFIPTQFNYKKRHHFAEQPIQISEDFESTARHPHVGHKHQAEFWLQPLIKNISQQGK